MQKLPWLLSMIPFLSWGIGTPPQNHKEIIFLWDVHHVILKPHGIIKSTMRYSHKREALGNGALRYKALAYAVKSMFKSVSSEEFIDLGNRYNNPHFVTMVVLASAAQKPLTETIDIIRELSKQGYVHHIGSNMGHTVFKEITDGTKYPQFKQIFQYFDLEKSHVVTLGAVKQKKPNPQFFCEYLKKNHIDLQKTRVIFIDDKKKNVTAAKKAGLDGIRFKNAPQLRNELRKRNIIIKS